MPLIEMLVYGAMLVGAIRAVRAHMSGALANIKGITLIKPRPPGATGDETGNQTEW